MLRARSLQWRSRDMPDDDVDALAAECSVAFGAGDTKGARDLLIKIKGTPARENGTRLFNALSLSI